MDHRNALQPQTLLSFTSKKGEVIQYKIEGEIGRGGSCIVYEVSRRTQTGDKTFYRMKEYYPYKQNIHRESDGTLKPLQQEEEEFQIGKEKFQRDFSRTNQLFYSNSNYASMVNQLDIFEKNGTSYIVSTYSSKKTLAVYKPDSLKECITLVKHVAYVLCNIHKAGYLYLDTKPENILVVEGATKQVQLFDFDSLLSISELTSFIKLQRSDIRVSYSRGFAPIELQKANIKRIGPYTDVFGVGALLFYLLFGYTPTAPQCRTTAVYDFSSISYNTKQCDNKIPRALEKFFHCTIAVYYADRYQTMEEAFRALEKLERYADTLVPRIYSTHIEKERILFGREEELAQMDRVLENPEHSLVFVTGMGGIGKSSFLREYLFTRRDKFDVILYVPYMGSIEATIINDNTITINTLRQEEERESDTRYFEKKLQRMKELLHGTSSILVIDNFIGKLDDKLWAVLQTGIQVILVSRQHYSYKNSFELQLHRISKLEALRQLFEYHLGRKISREEERAFEKLVHSVGGHTLVLELIAKQIVNSYLTVDKALYLAEKDGFTAIGSEKIDYEKDEKSFNDTIGNLIDFLFKENELSESKRILLKLLSLLGSHGIEINQFQESLDLISKDEIHELIKEGWVLQSGEVIFLHQVIWEAIHRWEWISRFLVEADKFLLYFYTEIQLQPIKHQFVRQAREILLQCKREKAICNLSSYKKLHPITVLNTPLYKEEYILEQSRIIFKNYTQYDSKMIMKLFHIVVEIHMKNGQRKEAVHVLKQAKQHSMYALYYNMVSEYYDILLNGAYDAETMEEKRLLKKLLASIEKTLQYSRKNVAEDKDYLYIKNILSKATILMRSGFGSDKTIKSLLSTAQKLIYENTTPFTDVRMELCLVSSWYFTLISENKEMVEQLMHKVCLLSKQIIHTDLERIEIFIIPYANMFLELGCYQKSLELLNQGIELCEKYRDMDAYNRIKANLQEYAMQVNSISDVSDISEIEVGMELEKNNGNEEEIILTLTP